MGIAPLDGLVHGATPVVHEWGGACTDIVGLLGHGYCYRGLRGAAEMVREALDSYNPRLAREAALRALEAYSYSAFRESIREALRGVAL